MKVEIVRFKTYIFLIVLAAELEAQSVVQLVFPWGLHTAIENLEIKKLTKKLGFIWDKIEEQIIKIFTLV